MRTYTKIAGLTVVLGIFAYYGVGAYITGSQAIDTAQEINKRYDVAMSY